jgi:hypothetical protein
MIRAGTARKQQKVAPIESDPRRIAEKIAEKLSEAGFSCVILNPSGPDAAIRTRPKDEARTHVALGKDTPCGRPIERFGDIVAYPVLGGLHHRYARI